MPFKGNKTEKSSVNYKARLEKKLYLAQESPEPVFDLSVCDLKVIPNNVFALCRVLRKEALYLQNNNLSSLTNSGSLEDLKNLKVLNISANKFNKLPSNINELESLEVLDVSKNQLSELPETLGDLTNLMSLNLSYNHLRQLPNSIGNCKSMEILDITYNENLKQLPVTLAKLNSLVQLNIDSTITYPPRDICSQGVNEILKFLSRELKEDVQIPSTSTKVKKSIPNFDGLEEKIELYEKLKQEKQNERLLLEKQLVDQNQKELEMHQKQKDSKKKLLEDVKNQQKSFDTELMKLQEKKATDHALLTKLCQEEEKHTNEIVNKILMVKRNMQLQYTKEWESERKAEEEALFNCSTVSRALERKQILTSMEEVMNEEILRAQKINADRKSFVVRSLATEMSQQNKYLAKVIKQRVKDTDSLLDTLRRNEELQKSAVASLLEKSDEKWWELTKQITIIEAQLGELTKLELMKRQLGSDLLTTELCKNRMALTELLMNLLDQQTQRKEQLLHAMRKMETMKESIKESEMFWMQQFDKLLRSKSHEMVRFLEAVNPKLVYELYINGVFQYLPLLKGVVLSQTEMSNLDNDTLIQCGVKSAEDRSRILRAVKTFLESLDSGKTVPTAPLLEEPSAPMAESPEMKRPNPSLYLVPEECVICLNRKPSVVFVPCGHLCCCYKCFKSVTLCPLCRQPIESVHEITNGFENNSP